MKSTATERSRYVAPVAMKDSWSQGEDRRDRGRADRGVARQRRSRSPARRSDIDRDPHPKDRDVDRGTTTKSSRPLPHSTDKPRERSPDRRRKRSRSPVQDSREEVRERNRGRELLDTRGSDKAKRSSHRSPSLSKRRPSRSVSPARGHHKKSRREISRSPSRWEEGSSRSSRTDKKRRPRSPLPHHKRSGDRKGSENHTEIKPKHNRDTELPERRGRSPSPRHQKKEVSHDSVVRHRTSSKYARSPARSPRRSRKDFEQNTSYDYYKDKERKRRHSPSSRRRSRSLDQTRRPSPGAFRETRRSRGSSPKRERTTRKSSREDIRRDTSHSTSRRPSPSPSRRRDIDTKSDKMDGRGYYGGPQGYPNQQMQAAFPLKAQYNSAPPQIDPRQYSTSPHHMTPNSYHGSPQAQSPYSAGRAGWATQQPPPHYSPQPQYQQAYEQPGYHNSQHGQYYGNQAQSPTYQNGPSGAANQQYAPNNYRGNQRGGYRGNNFQSRGRSDRGGRGSHYQNLHWNAGGAGRGQQTHVGNDTSQHTSPQYASHEMGLQSVDADDDEEDLFRPSKELQVEDTSKKDEEEMPPPTRPLPEDQRGLNSSKFSFAFKASSKAIPTTPKPEISQKLSAAPARRDTQAAPERSRISSTTRAANESVFKRSESREPSSTAKPLAPRTRIVKKIVKRPLPLPQLPDDLRASESVYFRKPGNESVVGSGTYGKVFKAVHVYTKELVALKKIRMEGERDGFPVTAVREIKLLQSLKHPSIVNLKEVMVEKNDCFMVFEYLSHDLTGLLNHPTFKLEPAHKKHLARQMFEGLDYLHRRGVLHRDIKAANILVSNEGILKFADFGLGRFYAKRRELDYTNRVITIWYRSPELLLGETQYGAAVDIWSAACVLVEIFTRHAIFPGDGGEISQLDKIYAVLGTPNKTDWPGVVDMAWFELLRPTARRANVFAEKYKERVTPAAFELLEAMFQYDPTKRPSASDVLEHPYFTVEEPQARQVIELAKLEGDWHEFESKALRKENERKDKEAKRQAQKEAAVAKGKPEKEQERGKKRASDGESSDRESKRHQTDPPAGAPTQQDAQAMIVAE